MEVALFRCLHICDILCADYGDGSWFDSSSALQYSYLLLKSQVVAKSKQLVQVLQVLHIRSKFISKFSNSNLKLC